MKESDENKLKEKFTEEEINEMKEEYGKNLESIFNDKELNDIKEDGEEIVLTKEEEKEFLNSMDNF